MTTSRQQLQRHIKSKGDKLFCLLFANSQPRLGTYIALADAIQNAGHLALVATREHFRLSKEELRGFESIHMVQFAPSEIRQLESIDLFFSAEVIADEAPPGAVTIGIPHSLPDAGLKEAALAFNTANFVFRHPTVIRTFDYLVSATRQSAQTWTPQNYALLQRVYPAEFLKHRRKTLDIVPGGYPKLDYSSRILASEEPLSSIVYSPTRSAVKFGRLKRDGGAIIGTLLSEFPHLNVVLRPYPITEDIDYSRTLAQRFAGNPRFVLDTSATGVTWQRRAIAAVTDSSSSALTFALATARPLVFVDLKPEAHAPSPLLKNPYGFHAFTVSAMVEAIKTYMNQPDQVSDSIRQSADRDLYNSKTAAAYLASHLETFASRKTHDDWLSVERLPWEAGTSRNDTQAHIASLAAWRDRSRTASSNRMYEEIRDYLLDPDKKQEPAKLA